MPKLLVVPEISPEAAKALVEATGRVAEELAEEEGGMEPEMEQVNSQLGEEVEELGTEEQEEDQECSEEPSELGDPAVMRAVRSKPMLEVMCERMGGPAAPPSIPTPLGPAPLKALGQGGRPLTPPSLQSQDSAVLDGGTGTCWEEFGKEDMVKMSPLIW